MPSPFPGMDPYLERPSLWPGFHALLISGIAAALAPHIAPAYYVAIEQRTYIASSDPSSFLGRPDVVVVAAGPRLPGVARPSGNGGAATLDRPLVLDLPMPDQITERYLEIRDSRTDYVVTVIEVLSPSNKQPGEGRQQYERKRLHVLATLTSLIEIDLLRSWQPMPMTAPPASDYRLLISRGWQRPRAWLYPFDLTERIPDIPVPLREREEEPTLELNDLLHSLYQQVRYDLRIDYRGEPDPPLTSDNAQWAQRLLEVAGLRS